MPDGSTYSIFSKCQTAELFNLIIHKLSDVMLNVCFFLQLSELEQRVLEAESRAEEAEDKVRRIRSTSIGKEIERSHGNRISLSLSSVIDYFPSRRWRSWRLSADRKTESRYRFLFRVLFWLFCLCDVSLFVWGTFSGRM